MERNKIVLLLLATGISGAASFGLAHAQVVGVTLPSIPTGVTATPMPPAQISVSWGASSESSGTIEGYYLYRNGSQIADTGSTQILDSGLSSGVYIYTVAAYDASGNVSAQSSPVSASLVADTTPPTTPTGVTLSGATTTNSNYTQVAVTVSWGASTDNVGVAGYDVYRNGTQIATSSFTGTSLVDMVPPGTYSYTVLAYDAAQNMSPRSSAATITINVDNAPPSTPKNVVAQQVSATGVNLTWATSTDAVGIAGYQVFRDGLQIASVTASPYSDTGLSLGGHSYTVAAYDNAGNVSQLSSPASVTMELTDGPSPPYSLSATLLGTSTVKLSWIPASDVLALTSYAIYRDNSQVGTATSTNYLDMGIASGTYVYSVSATDISGAVSATSSVTTIIVPDAALAPTLTPPEIIAPVLPGLTVSTTPSSPVVTTSSLGATFTQFLYFGLRSAQVTSLQSLLIAKGDLSATATGYFGTLTLHALEKFQCDENIVCTGGGGWGTVGPRTRSALNALQGGTTGTSSVSASSTSSANISAELQALEAELAALEKEN